MSRLHYPMSRAQVQAVEETFEAALRRARATSRLSDERASAHVGTLPIAPCALVAPDPDDTEAIGAGYPLDELAHGDLYTQLYQARGRRMEL